MADYINTERGHPACRASLHRRRDMEPYKRPVCFILVSLETISVNVPGINIDGIADPNQPAYDGTWSTDPSKIA